MKLFIFGLIALSGIVAHADSFTVIRDGKEYLCMPSQEQPPTDPNGAIECRNQAYNGPFSKTEAETLCQGSYTPAPAVCGISAYNGPFSKSEAISLCRSALSSGPALCANKAYSGPFSKSEAIELCSRAGSELNAECAIKAYNGAYSKAEAIKICKAEPRLILRALKLMEESKEVRDAILRNRKNFED